MTTTHTPTARTDTARTDTALLILRLAVGAAMVHAGLRKACDVVTTVEFMDAAGWRLPGLAAFMVTFAETAGGLGLIFGVLTPLAAFAVIAAMVDAWAVNVASAAIWENPFNAPFLIGAGTTVVLLAGAGRISVDAVLGRANWPTKLAVGLLVAAFVVAILTWVALLGTNPIHLTDPA